MRITLPKVRLRSKFCGKRPCEGMEFRYFHRKGRTLYFFTWWDTEKDKPVSKHRAYGFRRTLEYYGK